MFSTSISTNSSDANVWHFKSQRAKVTVYSPPRMGYSFTTRSRIGNDLPIPLSIIQTFRVDQKRTANISKSVTSTNDLGPLARYRIIYRFRRRTNYHDSTILSVNYLFFFAVSWRGTEACRGPQFKRCSPSFCSSHPSPRFPQNSVHFYPIRIQKFSLVLSPCAVLLTLALTEVEIIPCDYQRTIRHTGDLEPARAFLTYSIG